jgi:3-oxoacyl-[acyl-carrier protein] reductase
LDLGLSGKRVLVTGGSRGIGRSIALAFAGEGAEVALTYMREGEKAKGVVAEIAQLGRRSFALQADVARRSDVEAMVQSAVEKLGGIDIVVNNASTIHRSPAATMRDAEIDEVIDSNLKGLFLSCQAVVPVMRDKGGVIVNIASSSARFPSFGLALYAAVKAGVVVLTQGLAGEFGPLGIRVVGCSPGFTDTDRHAHRTPAERKLATDRMASGRYGQPEEVASAVLFLASRHANYIQGVTLDVQGGLMMLQDQASAVDWAGGG